MGSPSRATIARLAALTAHPDEQVRKQFAVSLEKGAVDPDARTVKFTITTGAVDRDNDTIDPKGWDVSEFLKNPVVLWAHDYSQLPVARAIDIVPTGDGLQSTAQFPPKGVYPFADTVFALIESGFLNASSVGFRPIAADPAVDRDGIDFKKQGLLEWSIVPVPANADALVVARSKGIDTMPIAKWATTFLRNVSGTVSRKQVGPTVTALLTALDDHVDAADELMDGILVALGIPGVNESPESVRPSTQPGTGAPAIARGTDPAVGETSTQPADVRPAGTATNPCPACGAEYDGTICTACGWQSPDAMPMDAPARSLAKAARRMADPARIVNGWKAVADPDDDPIRWNRCFSKGFDVAGEPLEPSRLEYAWVSRYLETPVQELSVESVFVPSARMGSFLAALDEGLSAWTVDAARNMTESGREVPPEYESLQLNSRTTRSFLVEGLRFMRRLSDGAKIVSKLVRHWSGLSVTHYVRHTQAEVRTAWVARVMARAMELNYLKGEAFTLSGEFLDRGDLDWSALFLDPEKEAPIRRLAERINEQGDEMESRGLILLGPPGTGKTLSGRVLMRQADTTFIWISARDFYRSGAFGAFTYAFDLAAECAPTILFFEDVDNWLGGTNSEIVDLLKTEMDGLKRRKGIATILTTNFPELLPDALIDRPGRFHDLVEVALPTEAIRRRMISAWLPEAPDAIVAATATQTEGYSGAHLRELVNFAGMIQREQQIGIVDALPIALEKIREQRALVEALREAPDYRPRQQVRRAVGSALALVAKRGRVLSAANEQLVRTAHEHLASVLGKLDRQPASEDDGDGKGLALRADDPVDGVIVLRLAAEDPPVTVDDITVALRAVIQDTISATIREQTSVALSRARGRVD